MSITLVAVVIALVLGHAAPQTVAAMRRFGWYGRWLRWLDANLAEAGFWRGRYGLVLALAPPLLLVGLVQWSLDARLLSLLFGAAVLAYAWGPRDLDLDVEAIVEAPNAAVRSQAITRLWPLGEAMAADGPALVDAVFRNALQRWFGVLFWFLLLGPFGALLYRLTALAANGEQSTLLPAETLTGARRFKVLLDWPVAQLVTLSMALVADFDTVFGAWRGAGGDTLRLDVAFLSAAARASVSSELAEEAQEYAEEGLVQVMAELPELRDAMSLVWRILLLWLAVLALFVIAGWVS
jgi:AmpE protein